ncbi:RNA cytidine acetyltransferase-like [Nerophis ophidion]|uniref:RNA cytidine acetyltransferase-like n=1 Tax=Nerophis ophidion TaxID=159077 RepID=UPI002AE011F2|nr:RNA cytidine acetyltransferase-like [Nerophis ophidion]
MLKELTTEEEQSPWLSAFWQDFRRRFLSLLSFQFCNFPPSLALSILQNKNAKEAVSTMSSSQLAVHFSPYDLKRLELYSRSMVDYHLIMDLVPSVARLFFLKQMGDLSLSAAQCALLLGLGLQHKSVEQLQKEIDLPSSQLLGLFNRLVRKFVQVFTSIQEKAIEAEMAKTKDVSMEPTVLSLQDDLNDAAKEFEEKHKQDKEKVRDLDLEQYKIRGDDEEWDEVLKTAGGTAMVSIKSDKKRKLGGGKEASTNGGVVHGKQRKTEVQHGKFKKNKHGNKSGKKAFK